MLANADLAGWASVLLAVSTLLGAVNATLSTLLHRRQRVTEDKVNTMQTQLSAHYDRVQGSYDAMVAESKGLLAYIQGLNTPAPAREKP